MRTTRAYRTETSRTKAAFAERIATVLAAFVRLACLSHHYDWSNCRRLPAMQLPLTASDRSRKLVPLTRPNIQKRRQFSRRRGLTVPTCPADAFRSYPPATMPSLSAFTERCTGQREDGLVHCSGRQRIWVKPRPLSASRLPLAVCAQSSFVRLPSPISSSISAGVCAAYAMRSAPTFMAMFHFLRNRFHRRTASCQRRRHRPALYRPTTERLFGRLSGP